VVIEEISTRSYCDNCKKHNLRAIVPPKTEVIVNAYREETWHPPNVAMGVLVRGTALIPK
jgi:hypothetical protein